LSNEDEKRIIDTIKGYRQLDDFSVIVNNEQMKQKAYSFGAGQYFETKIEYCEINQEGFNRIITQYNENLITLFNKGKELEQQIISNLRKLYHEN